MNVKKTQGENSTKYTDEDANSVLLASVHQRADNGLWMFMDFTGSVTKTNTFASRFSAEAEADVRFRLATNVR